MLLQLQTQHIEPMALANAESAVKIAIGKEPRRCKTWRRAWRRSGARDGRDDQGPRRAVSVTESFTNGKPWIVTDGDTKASWSGSPNRFRCGLCDHLFAEGDVARFQFMKSAPNFLICAECDGPDVAERFEAEYRRALAFAHRNGWLP